MRELDRLLIEFLLWELRQLLIEIEVQLFIDEILRESAREKRA